MQSHFWKPSASDSECTAVVVYIALFSGLHMQCPVNASAGADALAMLCSSMLGLPCALPQGGHNMLVASLL